MVYLRDNAALLAPLWDRIELDGRPVTLSEQQRAEVREFVDGWYVRHVALDSGRSSTWTSGLGVARMVRACMEPARDEIWPASATLAGEYGLSGVSLSVPVTLGDGGAARIEEWRLSDDQLRGLRQGAEFVRTAANGLG